MRKSTQRFVVIAILVVIAVFAFTNVSAGQDEPVAPTTTTQAVVMPAPVPLRNHCIKLYKQKYHHAYAYRVYHRAKVTNQARRKMARLRKCQRTHRLERKAKRYERDQYRARLDRQIQDAMTPFGRWAIPEYIVMCESGGRNLPPNSATASGYYQFINSTWRSTGGSTSAAYLASKAEQDAIAARLWAGGSGAGHWDCA